MELQQLVGGIAIVGIAFPLGGKVICLLLSDYVDPAILQNHRQTHTLRLYDGGYSIEAQRAQWRQLRIDRLRGEYERRL